MTGPLSTKRLARCPRCQLVLPVPANVPMYKCGGCNTVLQAKKSKNDNKGTDVHIPDTNVGKKKELEQDSEDKEAQNFSKEDKEEMGSEVDDYGPSLGESCSTEVEIEVDDYGPSLGESCSTEVEPFFVVHPFQSVERDSYERKMSSKSVSEPTGERKGGPIFKEFENKDKNPVETFAAAGPSSKMSKAGKTSSEIEELRPKSAKKGKNDNKDTDVHIPDTNVGKKKELEQDSEDKEAQNSSKEDKEARSLSKEERLSSSGELPLDKNNGSDEKENEDSNMNQTGITHHGNEESLPVAEADQDKCSLEQNNGGNPKEYVQGNGKHVGGVNFSDEVDSQTEPNHHKSAESEVDKSRNCMEEEMIVKWIKVGLVWKKKMDSDEVASPTEPNHRKSAERLSSAGELLLDKNNGSDGMENKDSDMNQSGTTSHGNEESLPVAEAIHDMCSLKQNNGGNPKDYVQCNGKHAGGVNFSDEVASPTEPNHHRSAESEADKSGNCVEEENGGVNISDEADEVASPTEPNPHKSAESEAVKSGKARFLKGSTTTLWC